MSSAQGLVKCRAMEAARIVGNVMAAANGRAIYAMAGVYNVGRNIALVKLRKLEANHVWKINVFTGQAQVGNGWSKRAQLWARRMLVYPLSS